MTVMRLGDTFSVELRPALLESDAHSNKHQFNE